MKKFGLWICIVLLFASCGNEITEITQVVEPNTFTKVYRIYADEMIRRVDPAGSYYECEIREPNLTNAVFDRGVLQAFLYYTKDGKDTLCPLPFSDFVLSGGTQREEQFTVEFQPGTIKFIQKISTHADTLPLEEFYEVLVRFLW
jgi:hypothetical protein